MKKIIIKLWNKNILVSAADREYRCSCSGQAQPVWQAMLSASTCLLRHNWALRNTDFVFTSCLSPCRRSAHKIKKKSLRENAKLQTTNSKQQLSLCYLCHRRDCITNFIVKLLCCCFPTGKSWICSWPYDCSFFSISSALLCGRVQLVANARGTKLPATVSQSSPPHYLHPLKYWSSLTVASPS